MKYLFFLPIFCFSITAFSQIGVNTSYQKSNQVSIHVGADFPVAGIAYGLDYWFRLANRRLEFTPELNYTSVKTDNLIIDINGNSLNLSNKAFSFYFNTNIYLFDFESDCDCPTFEKDGNFLKKGFFLQLSPGITYNNFTYTETTIFPEPRVVKDDNISYNIGGGVGIDFGVSEFLTITTFFKARYFPEVELEGYSGGLQNPEITDEFALWQYNLGLGVRLYLTDEYSRNKRMRNKREAKRKKRRN